MAQSTPLLQGATAIGAGSRVDLLPDNFRRGFVLSVTGTGIVSAGVVVQVSIDGIKWADRLSISASGTTEAVESGVDENQPFGMIRAVVSNISGTNAAVNLGVLASGA